jgi:hypothetical protein
MTDMLFANNYLEDIPKDIQMSIMGIVEKLDAKEKKIMDTIHEVYEKSCEGDMLYMNIERIIRDHCPNDEEDQESMDDTFTRILAMDDVDGLVLQQLPTVHKDYIINKVGVFKALRLYALSVDEEDTLLLICDTDDDHPYKYSTLYCNIVARTLRELFTDEEWDMIYKYELYNKYILSLDLEGIDTPTGFD